MKTKTKNRIKTILSILGVIVLVLGGIQIANWIGNNFFILPLAYGLAGSLDNLESEVNVEIDYRNELLGYLSKHNLTASNNAIDTLELESYVKKHMFNCKLGVDIALYDTMGNSTTC